MRLRGYCMTPMLLLVVACGNEIGDDCNRNVDCEPGGTRTCDTSQPGGYCTIEGCDRGTCPEEAICVRFFPEEFLSISCASSDDCGVDAICLSGGFCAELRTERRFCVRQCGTDGACRDDYSCQRTGVAGAELAQDADDYDADRVGRFCAPTPLP